METPWGPSQHQHQIADGIVQVSTASHGGILLSNERNTKLRKTFPDFTNWAGGNAYEEDCDVSVVILAFPECFDDAAIREAVRSVQSHALSFNEEIDQNWVKVATWLDTPAGQKLVQKMEDFEQKNADKWQPGSMGSCPEGWNVSFTRVGDRANKWVIVPRYPVQQFYSDEELAAVAFKAAIAVDASAS